MSLDAKRDRPWCLSAAGAKRGKERDRIGRVEGTKLSRRNVGSVGSTEEPTGLNGNWAWHAVHLAKYQFPCVRCAFWVTHCRVSVAVFMDADAEKPLVPVVGAGEVPYFEQGMTKAEIKELITQFNFGVPSPAAEEIPATGPKPAAENPAKIPRSPLVQATVQSSAFSGSEAILVRRRAQLAGA